MIGAPSMNIGEEKVIFRRDVRPADRDRVQYIVEAAGFFSHEEVEIAAELVDERLLRGDTSGYHFIFAELAELDEEIIGFGCFGPIPATRGSFDLYWMVVHPDFQRRTLGGKLLMMCESAIRADGGRQVYVETSGRDQYASTRNFYNSKGYRMVAVLPDFYRPGEAKIVYVKIVN